MLTHGSQGKHLHARQLDIKVSKVPAALADVANGGSCRGGLRPSGVKSAGDGPYSLCRRRGVSHKNTSADVFMPL